MSSNSSGHAGGRERSASNRGTHRPARDPGCQRRLRTKVIPIDSPASAIASLTILTLTRSTRGSVRNSVSQIWSATA